MDVTKKTTVYARIRENIWERNDKWWALFGGVTEEFHEYVVENRFVNNVPKAMQGQTFIGAWFIRFDQTHL